MGNQGACEMNVVENCVDQNQMLDPNASSQKVECQEKCNIKVLILQKGTTHPRKTTNTIQYQAKVRVQRIHERPSIPPISSMIPELRTSSSMIMML